MIISLYKNDEKGPYQFLLIKKVGKEDLTRSYDLINRRVALQQMIQHAKENWHMEI